ncbi:Glutamate receptor ionotropic, delta-2-like 22 [Homarus americanus]|uniref:Glutamate receptor ionotropic, delta-2-like 22 n=1 Tax=Homarus americanus TaxID=6706 RepID=A0A8J5T631_HOMAM|nr:Glutamate receptor ionotropic, delta-2-like 22 [Homarus americanus]
MVLCPPPSDTLVALVNTELPWPLLTPPQWWISSTLLLLQLNLTCNASRFFETRLAQQTPSVVLLCPAHHHQWPKERNDTHNNTYNDGDDPQDYPLWKDDLVSPGDVSYNDIVLENDLISLTIYDLLTDSLEEGTLVFRVLTWLPYDPDCKLGYLGTWDPWVFTSFSGLFYDRFQSMGGTTLHVSSDDDDAPLLFLDDDGEFEGTCKRILDVLSDWLNFTFTLTNGAPDSKWGEIENGTWVGLLGEVYKGNKDLAINYFTITHERTRYFDTSISYLTEGFGFVLPTPPELPRWRNLVYPFTWVVWVSVGGVLFTCGFSFYILTYLQPHHHTAHLFVSLAYVMRGLVNQSHIQVPHEWSLRMFLGGWWITAYVLVISYTCNLIAVLTVPVYPTRINTLGELAESNYREVRIKVCLYTEWLSPITRLCMLNYGEFVPDALVTSSDAEMRRLGGKMDLVPVKEDGYYGQEDCAALVLDNKNAHTETYAYLKLTYVDMDLGDNVYFMKEQIYEGNLAFIFQKNTPWRTAFNKGLRRLLESGFIQKWQKDIMEEYSRSQAKDGQGSVPRPLSVGHLQGAFFILVLGVVCAGLVFTVEYCTKTPTIITSRPSPQPFIMLTH